MEKSRPLVLGVSAALLIAPPGSAAEADRDCRNYTDHVFHSETLDSTYRTILRDVRTGRRQFGSLDLFDRLVTEFRGAFEDPVLFTVVGYVAIRNEDHLFGASMLEMADFSLEALDVCERKYLSQIIRNGRFAYMKALHGDSPDWGEYKFLSNALAFENTIENANFSKAWCALEAQRFISNRSRDSRYFFDCIEFFKQSQEE